MPSLTEQRAKALKSLQTLNQNFEAKLAMRRERYQSILTSTDPRDRENPFKDMLLQQEQILQALKTLEDNMVNDTLKRAGKLSGGISDADADNLATRYQMIAELAGNAKVDTLFLTDEKWGGPMIDLLVWDPEHIPPQVGTSVQDLAKLEAGQETKAALTAVLEMGKELTQTMKGVEQKAMLSRSIASRSSTPRSTTPFSDTASTMSSNDGGMRPKARSENPAVPAAQEAPAGPSRPRSNSASAGKPPLARSRTLPVFFTWKGGSKGSGATSPSGSETGTPAITPPKGKGPAS